MIYKFISMKKPLLYIINKIRIEFIYIYYKKFIYFKINI